MEALADLERLECACFDEPWSGSELGLYFASGALRAYSWACAGAAPLAYALFQLLPDEAELLRIGVVPAARGRGHGSRFLGAALAALACAARPVCHLEVRADNVAARRLYEGLGFRLTGRRRGYYADGGDALRYRRLAPAAGG